MRRRWRGIERMALIAGALLAIFMHEKAKVPKEECRARRNDMCRGPGFR